MGLFANKQRLVKLLVVTLLFPMASEAGDKIATNTLLIDKLNNVFLKLPESSPAKKKITLRLADLHAERGRLQAKKELEKGCLECTNGESDRQKALDYYQYALPTLKGVAKQGVLVQIGHIYEVLGQNSKAIEFYKKVIAVGEGKGAAEAQFSLAEIYFKQRNYKQAKGHYQRALQASQFRRRGLASFRVAWCQYNLGEVASATQGLEKILKNPELLTRGSSSVVSVDQDFKSEVAKDYTVFMAHGSQIGLEGIKKVYKLSPEKTKIENVVFLGKELERLGRVAQAMQAWELVVQNTGSPQIRMEGLVYLAGLQLKTQKKAKVLPYLKRAFAGWGTIAQCEDQKQCDELKTRVRRMVFDWNRSEKKQPSASLIEAYQEYFKVASKDAEGFKLASQAATLAKKYNLAYRWNKQALALEKQAVEKETLLLKQIEIAELAKQSTWLVGAQKQYLAQNPKGQRAPEIRYQMAQATYDSKEYSSAADQFRSIATSSQASQKVRTQAAEMALDALVLGQQDGKIEKWARGFASTFPSQRQRYLGIAGKSVLSQTAKLSTAEGVGVEAWQTLNRFDVSAASPEGRLTYLKNRVILARKLKKFDEMDQALRSLLSTKSLDQKDRTFALQNQVWLSELRLDFSQAFKSYKALNTKKWLELARFADLAEKPSSQYYYKYLGAEPEPALAYSICQKLVRQAGQVGTKQRPCVPHLKRQKNRFAGLLLELYGQKKTTSQLRRLFKSYDLTDTAAFSVISRDSLIAQGAKRFKPLAKHKLDGRANRVGRSLKRRMNLITGYEKVIAQATETRDWLTQTLFLTQLRDQYLRFYNDLLALPTPSGLTEQEQQEYLTLLSQQAAPYKEKASEIDFKLVELWKNQKAIDQLYADFHKSSRPLQAMLGPQIEKLKTVLGPQQKAQFELVYKKEVKGKVPSLALLEQAREEVKRSPLSKVALQNLIRLETARGYQPMVIYLNSRLKRVDQGFEAKEASL